MNKTALVYGLATGLVILVTFFALSQVMGPASELTYDKFKQAEAVGSIRYLVIVVGIVMAMLAYRKQQAGAVTYKSAIGVGIQAALVVGILVGLMEAAWLAMNPEFADAAKQVYIEGMEKAGKSAEEIAKMERGMDAWSFMGTPLGMGAWYLFETTLAGTVVALIAGIFVKRAG